MRTLPLLGSCLLVMLGCGGSGENVAADQLAADTGCTLYAPLNGTTSITLNSTKPVPTIVNERSLVITKQTGYSALVVPFTLGRMLKDDANFINYHICQDRQGDKLKTLTDFVRFPFQAAASDVDDHNNWTRVKVGTVSTIRNTFQDRILTPWLTTDENGPFRLLAVVNRMDLAGDIDTRGGSQFAGGERRWFGEGRLVFGLTQDISASTPYPMTLIMEYRLPALKETVVGTSVKYEVDTSFNYVSGPQGDEDWRARRARWAKIWRELSRYDPTDTKYQSLLLDIVKLFATGDNHLALRTGEKVYNTSTNAFSSEFEYREFYLNDQWNVATRKLRREPILCSQGSDTLEARILEDWNAPANDFHFGFMLGDRELEGNEKAELSDRCGKGMYVSPDGLPYGQELKSGGYGLRAKFTRFKSNTLWTVGDVDETMRHKTAAATCSGCHAKETENPTVFHIGPRLAGDDSEISNFLKKTVTFTLNGTPYTLTEMSDRSTRLAEFATNHDYSDDYPSRHVNEQLYCNVNPCSDTEYPPPP